MSLFAALPEVTDAELAVIYPKDRDGCASFEVVGYGWIVRHHDPGWSAFDLHGRCVGRGVSNRSEAVALLVAP